MNELLMAIVIAAGHAPLNRSCYMEVTSQGKVAVIWQETDGTKTYAQVGYPDQLSSPQLVAARPFTAKNTTNAKYNIAHNAPFLVPYREGFLAFSGPMNANGYAQGFANPPTGYGWLLNEWWGGWTQGGMAPLANWITGSSVSNTTAAVDRYGVIHMWGQGHLNGIQGGFGWQKLSKGVLYSKNLASALYVNGLNYFLEGSGVISKTGKHHVAFGWNKQGDTPNYGLHYMVSNTDGSSWTNVKGDPVTIPVKHTDTLTAIVPPALNTTKYDGALQGASAIQIGEANDQPLILKPIRVDATYVQNYLYTFTNGKWTRQGVGPKLFWNTNGAGVYFNPDTQQVNVVLLDAGHISKVARVLRYSQPLSETNRASWKWNEAVIASIPQTSYASSLQVRVAKGNFYSLIESNYKNPGTVEPLLHVFKMR